MRTILRLGALAFTMLIAASAIQGQVATGTYPYGTFDNPGIDTINVGSLNVHFAIPVLNKTGRGMPFTYNLSYDSSVWTPTSSNGALAWTPVLNWGWRGETEVSTGYISESIVPSVCSTEKISSQQPPVANGWYTTTSLVVYHDPWGVAHPFAGSSWTMSSTCGSTASGGAIGPIATDGSGYQYVGPGTIMDRSGKTFAVPLNSGSGTATATDANGNEISVNSSGQFTDTTGNIALTVAGTPPSAETFTYTNTGGQLETVTMTYTTYTVQTAFGCSGIGEFGPTSEPLVSSITFPDGSEYQFSYEATPGVAGNVTGRLASVTLPQGGLINYSYSGGSNGIECADGSTAGLTRAIASNAGSAASSQSYTRTITGTGTSSTAVVDGLNNNKTYTFVEASNQSNGSTAEYYETSRSVYQGAASGTPVIVRNTCYNATASPCTTTMPSVPISQIDTYETLNGLETHGTTAMYDTYGNQAEAVIFDYASGATSRGLILSEEYWNYGYSVPGLPTEDAVYDASGDLAQETMYSYDATAPTASSGVPQHIAASGPRGNLTGETVYVSPKTSLSSPTTYSLSATYEDTGSVLTSTNPNGTTTYSYDPTFVYNTGTTLPTPSSGVAIATGASYDTANTGLPLTSTDQNGLVTHTPSYDSMLRPLEVQYPDGGETTWSYSPTSLVTTTLPSSSSELQYDAYGRTSRIEVANGQSGSGFYQQDTCYDANGNVSFVSYPYQGSGFGVSKICSGSGGDTSTYDVLGRLTSVVRGNGEARSYTFSGRAKQSVDESGVTRISQVDGLGRSTIVCEVASGSNMLPSGTSASSCGTDIPGTGFPTTYSYALSTHTTTITQGVQTRVFQTDYLGRPILVQEPESGTTTYSYAYNGTGLVSTRTRPQANQTSASLTTTTTTQYDSLNRVVSISYSDGTPTKNFAYDQADIWGDTGVSTGSARGRLTSASSSVNAQAFVYDPMGRVTGNLQCLPTECGTGADDKWLYYSYDLAGNMLTSSDGAGVTSTYSVSPANEILSITSSTNNSTNPSSIVSSVQNGPNGPNTYSLGNGLTGISTYDGLGRTAGGWICSDSSQAGCTGGTQLYGFTSTWTGVRQDGGCDTVLNQCLGYGYDGFNRLVARTVNAGTAQNYTYAYDRYGNRWSQTPLNGGSTFSVSFNEATNQINTSPYTYDAAGNLTYDGSHSYTYDADGNITAVDSGSTAQYAYNALNQRVQTVVGSANTEFVFNLAGQKVSTWNGATAAQVDGKYFWGARPVAYYLAGGATFFEHQDWLGTERARTTYNGALEGTFTSMPFGDDLATASGADNDAYHFAMLDHDYETDTDHAQFRQYSNVQGRWMSPDPYSSSYRQSNPQSFNRYAYTISNPLSSVDPSGLEEVDCDSGDTVCVSGDPDNCDSCGGGGSPGPGEGISGGIGGAGGNSAPSSAPNNGGRLHNLVCSQFADLLGVAKGLNSTIGVGVGGSGGVGFILGIAASAGIQVVADSSGNLGVAINLGGNPGYGVFGAGVIGGAQASISTANTIYDLRGGSYDFGASGGAGPAYGIDVSGGDGGYTGTVTVGAGIGGKGSALSGVYTWIPSALSTKCP